MTAKRGTSMLRRAGIRERRCSMTGVGPHNGRHSPSLSNQTSQRPSMPNNLPALYDLHAALPRLIAVHVDVDSRSPDASWPDLIGPSATTRCTARWPDQVAP